MISEPNGCSRRFSKTTDGSGLVSASGVERTALLSSDMPLTEMKAPVSFGKWLSLGVGFVTTALAGAGMLIVRWNGWLLLDSTPGIGAVLVAALGLGAIIGLLHWLVVVWIARPFTPLRESRVEVRINEIESAHTEAILDSITDAVLVSNASDQLVLANHAAAPILGCDRDSAIHQPIDRVIPDADLVKLIKETRQGATSSLRQRTEHYVGQDRKRGVYDITIARIAPNGNSTQSGADLDTDTPPPHPCQGGAADDSPVVVTILRDIAGAKQFSQMNSNFVSNISHELRTPLSSIKAYVEMLIDGEARDEQTKCQFYDIIQDVTNRLTRLIDNILDISWIESGLAKVHREHVSLQAMIDEVIDAMEPQAQAKKIELVNTSTSRCSPVFVDKSLICRALLHLLGNAIKYSPRFGRVNVRVNADAHNRIVQLSVEDSAVSVFSENNVLDRLSHTDRKKQTSERSSVELSLVKHIIENIHDGALDIRSETEKGSTVTCSLPMADNAVPR